jgi:hypothetical protein
LIISEKSPEWENGIVIEIIKNGLKTKKQRVGGKSQRRYGRPVVLAGVFGAIKKRG